MNLGLRARIAFWCAGLVIASGVVIVLVMVVLSGRFLEQRNKAVDQRFGPIQAAGAPAGGAGAGGLGANGSGQGAAGTGTSGPAGDGAAGTAGAPALGASGVPVPTPRDQARRAASEEAFRDVRKVGLGLVVAISVLAVLVAWLVAGQIVRPISRVTHTARAIAATDQLDRRLALSGPHDEVRELGDAFDGMMDRLQTVFAAQRSFVSNTSHELRTPLAVMRTEIDVALDDPAPDVASMREALQAVGEELDHTSGLVEAMLSLSRAESLAAVSPVDLAEVARARLDRLPAGTLDGLDLQLDLGSAPTSGDAVLLSRLVANLVANAARYNRPGGLLRVRTAAVPGRVELVVENDGPVVDPAVVPALFARFVRRAEAGEGYGLGLPIVDAIVSTHHGSLAAHARPQGGLRIEVTLPARSSGIGAAPASAAGGNEA